MAETSYKLDTFVCFSFSASGQRPSLLWVVLILVFLEVTNGTI